MTDDTTHELRQYRDDAEPGDPDHAERMASQAADEAAAERESERAMAVEVAGTMAGDDEIPW